MLNSIYNPASIHAADPVFNFDFSTVPIVESAEPEPAPQPELADPPQVADVEETLTPSPPQQPAAENSKGTVKTGSTRSTAPCISSDNYLRSKVAKCLGSFSC